MNLNITRPSPVLLALLLGIGAVVRLDAQQPTWEFFGSLSTGRDYFCATYIGNQQILVIGGHTNSRGIHNGVSTSSCEIIDLFDRTISPAASMYVPRSEFVTLLTPDSNVIAISGLTVGEVVTTSCELYDRATRRWRVIGDLIVGRRQHQAAFINGHEILVVGGRHTDLAGMSDAEIFDITTGTSRRTGDYPHRITNHATGISSMGSFLGVGGREDQANSGRWPQIWRYDPAGERWGTPGTLPSVVQGSRIVKMWDGRLVTSGGAILESPLNLCDGVWLEENDAFSQCARMQIPRELHHMAQWSPDTLMTIGGWDESRSVLRSTDWINMRTGESRRGPELNIGRLHFLAVSVPIAFDSQGNPIRSRMVAISGLDSTMNNTPTVEILERCSEGGAFSIGRRYKATPGDTLTVPVMLDLIPGNTIGPFRYRMEFAGDMMRLINDSVPELRSMIEGTLLDGWDVSVSTSKPGLFEAYFRPTSELVSTDGILLKLMFKTYISMASAQQMLWRDTSTLSFSIEPDNLECTRISTVPGFVDLDLCGLGYRLIERIPDNYALDQNSPNPFNPTSVISFSLGLDGPTTLEILDASGRKVATLVNAHMAHGRYQVRWDASEYPSGLYYYRLASGDWSRTNMMMLVK